MVSLVPQTRSLNTEPEEGHGRTPGEVLRAHPEQLSSVFTHIFTHAFSIVPCPPMTNGKIIGKLQ